jgi:hypothetical protein
MATPSLGEMRSSRLGRPLSARGIRRIGTSRDTTGLYPSGDAITLAVEFVLFVIIGPANEGLSKAAEA